jgi:hypothetical protein
MAYQPINLGTPNNNDGDSLFAGGTKINANFSELYVALSGSSSNTLRIDLSSNTVKGNVLRWSDSLGKFVAGSSTSLRSLGANASSYVTITNNAGYAGVENEISGLTDALLLLLNGRGMFSLGATGASITATRGAFEMGLGNANVTSLSVYTTGVVVRGLYGLEVYRAVGVDTAAYTKMMDTQTSGMVLYRTPIIDTSTMAAAVLAGTDSSNAIAHTGFVKYNLQFKTDSSTTMTASTGLQGGGNLTSNRAFNVNPYFFPNMCEGLLYSYDAVNNRITVTPGAATHYSYSTTGATIVTTSTVSMVSLTTSITKTWTTGWTLSVNAPYSSSIGAIAGTQSFDTWYYVYLIAQTATGTPDFIVSANRDIVSVQTQIAATTSVAVEVIRRLGPLKTVVSSSAVGYTGNLTTFTTPVPVGFTVERLDQATLRYNWGLYNFQRNAQSSITSVAFVYAADTAMAVTITSTAILQIYHQTSNTALAGYNSSVLTSVPPLPGVKARMDVYHYITPNPWGATGQAPQCFMYGEAWVSSGVTTTPPWDSHRMAIWQTGGPNMPTASARTLLSMSPDSSFISDAQLSTAFTSTGARIRFLLQRQDVGGGAPAATNLSSTLLTFNVSGFDVTR